jgi:hypothetical protein
LVTWSGSFEPSKNILVYSERDRPLGDWEDERRLVPKVIRKISELRR